MHKNSRKAKLLLDIEKILSSNLVVVVSVSSLTAEDIFLIRRRLWSLGGNINIVKNSVARLALKKSDVGLAMLPSMSNTVAFASCDDDITRFLRLLLDISREYGQSYFNLSSGKFDSSYLSMELMEDLASLDNLSHIYLRLVGVLHSSALLLADSLRASSIALVSNLDCYNKCCEE